MVQTVQTYTPGTQELVQTTARITTMVPIGANEKLNASHNEWSTTLPKKNHSWNAWYYLN